MGAAVTVLGAGSWGTALAIHLARVGHDVSLWGREASHIDALKRAGENPVYLPGVAFPPNVTPVDALDEACARAEMIVVVVPSGGLRATAEAVRPLLRTRPLIVTAAKGVEQETRLTMSAVLVDVLGNDHEPRVTALSGPSFAREVAHGMPTAVTAAATDLGVAEAVQRLFTGPTFRVYTSTD